MGSLPVLESEGNGMGRRRRRRRRERRRGEEKESKGVKKQTVVVGREMMGAKSNGRLIVARHAPRCSREEGSDLGGVLGW